MIRVSGHGSSAAAVRLWRPTLLAAAATIAATTQADAALDYYYGQFYQPYYAQPVVPRQKPRRRPIIVKKETPEKETSAKPQAPLIISISIDRQKLRLYDANGFFAEAPVSTGMRGHSTPMGVFSVIQKQKFHRSNIYSGAPMPFMQRITWSGIAIHAGVLPGYPASHGCIRTPPAFAIKMYNWTRMGARVIITPGELTPESFSHPLLATFKVPPQPAGVSAPEADVPLGVKSDRGAPDSVAGLRPGVGHDDQAATAADNAISAVREQTRTADAGGDGRAAKDTMTISDAATGNALPHDETATAGGAAKANTDPADANKKPDPAATATTQTGPAAPDANKDQSRLSEGAKPAATPPEAAKRAGQIAVFISRKDAKLYVRQNFSPLFEVPVTIAPSDRPLGTHVFTAEVDKKDTNALRWSVVSMPRVAHHNETDERRHRRLAGTIATEATSPPATDSAAEALDRLTVPADTMARINEMLTTGASIIVSDQGINQGETGEGTDFIVRLR